MNLKEIRERWEDVSQVVDIVGDNLWYRVWSTPKPGRPKHMNDYACSGITAENVDYLFQIIDELLFGLNELEFRWTTVGGYPCECDEGLKCAPCIVKDLLKKYGE